MHEGNRFLIAMIVIRNGDDMERRSDQNVRTEHAQLKKQCSLLLHSAPLTECMRILWRGYVRNVADKNDTRIDSVRFFFFKH